MGNWGKRKDGQSYPKDGKKGIKSSVTSAVSDIHMKENNSEKEREKYIKSLYKDCITLQQHIIDEEMGGSLDEDDPFFMAFRQLEVIKDKLADEISDEVDDPIQEYWGDKNWDDRKWEWVN